MKPGLRSVRPTTPIPCLVIVGAKTVNTFAVGGSVVASLPDLYDATDDLLARYPVGTLVVRASDRVALRVVMPVGWIPGAYRRSRAQRRTA